MKLVSFSHADRTSWGVVVNDAVIDLGTKGRSPYKDVLHAIQENGLDAVRESADRHKPDYALEDIRFERPVPWPPKIVCVGVNYRNRNEEYRDGSDIPKYPSLFFRTAHSMVGHNEPIVRPPESAQLDYEGEIALVIGKPGRRIPEERALEHVAALTCANEGTIRDWLRHGKFNVTQGKNFDRTGSVGPWLVTKDEFPSLERLRVTTRVNQEIRQDDSTENLIFSFRHLISYISTFTTLYGGDVILTGTPTGAGARFTPPKYLVPGDTVEVEVSGIGILRNTIADES